MLPALLPNQVGLFKSSGFYEVWNMVILSFNMNNVFFCPSFGLKLHCFLLFAFKGRCLYSCFCFIILCKILFSQLYCTFFVFPKCYWFEIIHSFKILFVSAFLTNLLDFNTNYYLTLSSAFVVSKLTWIARDFSWKFYLPDLYWGFSRPRSSNITCPSVAEGYAVTCPKSNNQ